MTQGAAAVQTRKAAGLPGLMLEAMRPHQWVKNLFVLAPLLFSQKLTDGWAVARAASACAGFCLMASAIYLLNDVMDMDADRAHPEKRFRPIASGALSAPLALAAAGALLAGSIGIAAWLGKSFFALAALYFVIAAAYSLGLKRAPILDGMIIAAGFVLRVAAGAAAVHVFASHWLILCAFLLALYLAFAKRRQELLMLSESATAHRRVLGEYTVSYLDQVNNILLGATVVCYALYTVSPETVARFGTDLLIYGTAFVLYGLLRYMALIQSATQGGNPAKLLLRDKPLLIAVLGWTVYNTAVIYGRAAFPG